MSEVVRVEAQRLLPGLAMADDVKREGRVERVIPIVDPNGLHGWFVPVAVGSSITGFFRFLANDTLLGYSEFPPSARTPLSAWTDVEMIRRRAEAFLKRPGKGGTPQLTYDGAPSRIAWRVPFPESGQAVFVVGETVYKAK